MKFKKSVLAFGSVVAVAAPIATVVACGDPTLKKHDGIYFVADGGSIKDKSFNQSVLEGMQDARGVTGGNIFTDNVFSPASASEIENKYSAAAAADAKLIVAAGFNHGDALESYAPSHRDINFVWVDGELKDAKGVNVANVASIQYNMLPPAFIMGVAAAESLKTKSNAKIGIYGGMSIPSVDAYLNGFKEGVKFYNDHKKTAEKDVLVITGDYVGGFGPGGKSKTIADKLANDGAMIELAVGGPQWKDAMSAMKTKHGKIIGVDVVTGGANGIAGADKDYVFGSILKNLRVSTKKIVEAIIAKSTTLGVGHTYLGTLTNNGVGISIDGVTKTDLSVYMKSIGLTDAEVTAVIAAANAAK